MDNHDQNFLHQKENILKPKPKRTDYYTTKGKKIRDFLIGFIGIILILLISTFLSSAILYAGLIIFFFFLGIIVFLLILLSIKGRRFIVIGAVSFAIIPLIGLGSCLLIINSF